MRWYFWVGLVVIAVLGYAGFRLYQMAGALPMPGNDEERAAVRAESAAQNEQAFYRPHTDTPLPAQVAPNAINNVYFGDLHVHSALSFDAYLFGNRLGLNDAYAVATGEGRELPTGEVVQLSRPLDFVAVTDHAEGFGSLRACRELEQTAAGRESCDLFERPTLTGFLKLRNSGLERPMVRDLQVFSNDADLAAEYTQGTWREIVEAAERHNAPGIFTAFAAYEYSPVLPDRGKHHRNVVFKNGTVPGHAVSAYDAASEIDLWKQLASGCIDDCEFLTIPHNLNKTWGLAFAGHTIDGDVYTDTDWRLRERYEPIVEMFQIKGNSECSTYFGAGDEECGFEQFLPVCEDDQQTGCIHPTSMARDGLHIGLALEQTLGLNPIEVGFIGSTDAHNSNPGDAEEYDYRGGTVYASSPALRRVNTAQRFSNPGGLAAVWAPENTRDALFTAMQRKEVYATSGTRIKLRSFVGFNLPADLVTSGDIQAAYEGGVPMGGSLSAQQGKPSLFVWAVQDPDHAPLAKLQVIKGWLKNGKREERVYDVACAGSELDAATSRCANNEARVDLADCSWDAAAGAAELKTLWQDQDYSPDQNAFYYVRVVQNPTCRYTTYDSLRLGITPPADVSATVTEMAWSSPMWIKTTH